jgi:hypothetical protein
MGDERGQLSKGFDLGPATGFTRGTETVWLYNLQFSPRPWQIDPIFRVCGRPQPTQSARETKSIGNSEPEHAKRLGLAAKEAEAARQQRSARIQRARRRFERLQQWLIWLDWGLAVLVTGWGFFRADPLWVGLGVIGFVFAALRVGERISNTLLRAFVKKKV